MTSKLIYQSLPSEIKSLLVVTDGWLVGGALRDISLGKEPKDYDIIVPDSEAFRKALTMIDVPIQINTFGGIKFMIDGILIDIWVEQLDHFLKVAISCPYSYNITKQILLKYE